MAFAIFPEKLAPGFVGGPNYEDNIVGGSGGFEDVDLVWGPQHEYQFSVQPLPMDEVHEILHFFHNQRGRTGVWLLRDPADFDTTGEAIGSGDGSKTEFQIIVTYDGDDPLVRNIRHPKSGTVKVYLDGVLQTEDTDYTIDYDTGIITFTLGSPAGPANGVTITADFEFYVPVRFGEKRLDTQVLRSESGEGLASFPSLSAIEVFE